MQVYADYIKQLDPTADPELVLNIADEVFRFFGEMTEADWRECIADSKRHEVAALFA